MSDESFRELEQLFHELTDLSDSDRRRRLVDIESENPAKARALRFLFEAITESPDFLDPGTLGAESLHSVSIPIDGTARIGDRFLILERIGTGGTSTVFRAKDEILNRDVAIKMLRCGLVSDNMRSRFDAESKTLASLTHPHIAHVYQTGVYEVQGEQIPWIAMELVRGSQSIIEYVQQNDLGKEARIDLFLSICDAIEASHRSGILHLDLNASNILIDQHGFPKIIDFGLFSVTSSTRAAKAIMVGTRTSMAPEQTVFNAGEFDERTDVYALGLLLVHLLTGVRLQSFENISSEDSCKLIAMGKAGELLEEVKDIDPELRTTIGSMIRVDPDDRIGSVAQVAERIRRLRITEGHKHRPVTIRTAAPILLLLVVLLTASAIYFRPKAQQTPPPQLAEPMAPDRSRDTIQVPSDVVVEVASANPRKSNYSENHAKVINSLAAAIESDDSLAPLELAGMHSSLADHYRIAGDYAQATKHFALAADLYKAYDTPESYNYSMMSLIQNSIFLEQYDRAQRSIDLLDRSTDLPDLFLIDLSIVESRILLSTGSLLRAERQALYTKAMLDELPASYNTDKVERLLSQSEIFASLSQPERAAEALDQASRLAEQVFEPTSTDLQVVRIKAATKASAGAEQSGTDNAEQTVRTSIQNLEAAGDQFHAAWGMRQLGHWYFERGLIEQALDSYRSAYNAMSRILGSEHHETIRCAIHVALCERSLSGESEENNQRFSDLVTSLSSVLGEHHSIVAAYKEQWSRIP